MSAEEQGEKKLKESLAAKGNGPDGDQAEAPFHWVVGPPSLARDATPKELADMSEEQAEARRDRDLLDYAHGGGITKSRMIAWQDEIGSLNRIVIRMARHQAQLIGELAAAQTLVAEAQATAARLAQYHQGLFFRLAAHLEGDAPIAPLPVSAAGPVGEIEP